MIYIKLIIDDFINDDLKEYLLTQSGINKVTIEDKNGLTEININYNEKTNPITIFKFIELFLNTSFPILMNFDKNNNDNCNKIKYVVKDMCCEYCYKGFVTEMFNNQNVKSLSSNFDFLKPALDIEINIEYSKDISEKDMLKYINDSL